MIEAIEFERCPRGCSDIDVNKACGFFYVACSCGWEGPHHDTVEEATDAWNARLSRSLEDELVTALEAAKEWLEGWASAEIQIAIIDEALAKAKAP